jgi:hypothetical protein
MSACHVRSWFEPNTMGVGGSSFKEIWAEWNLCPPDDTNQYLSTLGALDQLLLLSLTLPPSFPTYYTHLFVNVRQLPLHFNFA